MENSKKFFDQYFEMQNNMMKKWNDLYSNFNSENLNSFFLNPYEAYKKMLSNMNLNDFTYTGSASEVFNNITKASQLYYQMYKMYQEMYQKSFEPTEEKLKELMEKFKNESVKYINSYIFPFIPEQIQKFLKDSFNIQESITSTYQDIFGPWVDNSKNLLDNFIKGAYFDPDGFLEFFKLWEDNYQKTFGKLLTAPGFGKDKNFYEQQMKTFDKYIDFLFDFAKLSVRLTKVVTESTEEVIRDNFEMIKSSSEPKSFEEFYDYWKKHLSNSFDKLFFSEEFSKFLGQFVESVMDLKISNDRLMEKILAQFPIPTNKDMDSLYKTVYELKKEVRLLKKELKELKKQNFDIKDNK